MKNENEDVPRVQLLKSEKKHRPPRLLSRTLQQSLTTQYQPQSQTIRPIIINQDLDDFTQILNNFHDLLPGIDINQVLMEITKQERIRAY